VTGAPGEASIAPGMRAQLARRAELLDGGAEPIGWKVGFNVPAIQERLGIERPVAGFMTTAGLVADGAELTLGGDAVLVEPEVAVELGADVPGGADPGTARAAIAALLPALEVTVPPDLSLSVEQIVAGNVFHRAVAFGPRVEVDAPGAGRLIVNGAEQARIDPEATVAHLAEMVSAIAGRLADAGERLRAGERIITGVLAPPPRATAGDWVRLELDSLGGVEIGFS
jgi:2-keto-4-pentenoate hydratase